MQPPHVVARFTKLYEAKLAERWFQQGGWVTDVEAARARAAREGKPILAFFTRSYTKCGRCRRIETGPLSDPRVRGLAEQAVLLCHVTSGVLARRDEDLWQRLQVGTWGKLLILDSELETISRAVAPELPRIERALSAARSFLTLRGKSQRTARQEADLLMSEIRLGRLSSGETRRRRAALTPSPFTSAESSEVDAYALGRDIWAWDASLRGRATATREMVQEKALAAYRAGSRPPAVPRLQSLFWRYVLDGAESAGDLAAFEAAFPHVYEHTKSFWSKESTGGKGVFANAQTARLDLLRTRRTRMRDRARDAAGK